MSRERTTRFGNSGEGNYESPGSLHLKRRNTAISALVLLVVYLFSTIGASALPGDGHLTKGWTAPGSTNASLALPHDGVIGGFTPQPASSDPNGLLACAWVCCPHGKSCCLYHQTKCVVSPHDGTIFGNFTPQPTSLWQAMPLIAASPKGNSTDMFSDTGPWVQVRTIRGRVESPARPSSQQLQVN